jgi:ankyrin repeat protein
VQLLLDAGAAVSAIDTGGGTPLFYGAQQGHFGVVKLLLDFQAAANAVAANGRTALHFAAQQGHTAVVELLLHARAAANAADDSGGTALHQAAWNGHLAVVQVLLDAAAEMNSADAWGRTPVYCAATAGHTLAVQLLLSAPQLTTEAMAGAARAAAAAGHTELAIMVVKALMSRDSSAAAAELADPPLAAEVLRSWEAAEASVQQQEARWPALQELVIGIAGAHQQLPTAAAAAASVEHPLAVHAGLDLTTTMQRSMM